MIRLIKIPSARLEKKVDFICKIRNWQLSSSELALLVNMCRSGLVGINVDPDTAQALIEGSGIAIGSFNVVLSRLVKKGCIRKNGRVINLHPALMDLDNCNEYVVRFIQDQSGT